MTDCKLLIANVGNEMMCMLLNLTYAIDKKIHPLHVNHIHSVNAMSTILDMRIADWKTFKNSMG